MTANEEQRLDKALEQISDALYLMQQVAERNPAALEILTVSIKCLETAQYSLRIARGIA